MNFTSLAPGRCGSNFKSINFTLISLGARCESALRWIPRNLTNEQSNIGLGNGLVTSGSKPLPDTMYNSSYGVARPHWVDMISVNIVTFVLEKNWRWSLKGNCLAERPNQCSYTRGANVVCWKIEFKWKEIIVLWPTLVNWSTLIQVMVCLHHQGTSQDHLSQVWGFPR